MKEAPSIVKLAIAKKVNDMQCECPACGHVWKKKEHQPCRGMACPACGHTIGSRGMAKKSSRGKIAKYYDLGDVEDALGQYLSDDQEEYGRKAVERNRNFALRHPVISGLGSFGLWPAIAKEIAVEKATRSVARKYPEVGKRQREIIKEEKEQQIREDKANQASRVAGTAVSGGLSALNTYLNSKRER